MKNAVLSSFCVLLKLKNLSPKVALQCDLKIVRREGIDLKVEVVALREIAPDIVSGIEVEVVVQVECAILHSERRKSVYY